MVRQRGALAKIAPPRLHDVLARTRLFGLLDKAARRPVVWLSGQPGAGKTTLVASYLAARKRPGIWYQVDDSDADPASLIYHLRLAADSSGSGKSASGLPLLTPEYADDVRSFARRFFRDLFAYLGPDAALVLDNFQEAPEGCRLHEIMAEAMQHVPEASNVFIVSRGEPPAAYAPLLASDAIATLDGEALRLTLSETKAIARRRGVDEDAAVEALHARSHGWAAGLTLLLARRPQAAGPAGDDAAELQLVFGYFAQRVFDGATPEHRQALMQLASLPSITLDVGEKLTGLADVGRLLDHYYKRHLFTDRRRVAAPAVAGQAPGQTEYVFQFHALFRAFLQFQARAALGSDACRNIAARAGRLLDQAGHWEQALGPLAEGGDWDGYGRVMDAHAEGLLAQGRQQTVIEWLRRMPEGARESDPWLGYWEGRALMPTVPERALRLLQASHARFVAAGDAAGQFACAAAAVQALWYARLGWSEIASWVDRLEPLLSQDVRFPTAEIEVMSYSAVHAALAFCRPAHPALLAMGKKLLELVDEASLDWNQRLSTATHLITWLHNAAEHDLASRLIGRVDAAVETHHATALNRAFWFVFRAIHDIRQAKYEESSQRFRRAEEIARREGLVHAEFAAVHFHGLLDVMFRLGAAAQARADRLETHPARGSADAEMNFFVLQAMAAQLRGDVVGALAAAQRGLDAIQRVGAAYFQAVFPPLLASAFVDAGQPERAHAIVAASRAAARGSYLEAIEAQLLLEEAYAALAGGDLALADARLAQGLALAANDRTRAAYVHRIVARKPQLLVRALAAGIETEFVRQLIRRWRVAPPPREPAAWPWPIRVHTLGAFEVLVDDRPIEFGRKAPKKTLALLKAIIARGGSAPESALIDTFWPDEEGDAATRSLGAAVHRLRSLLGHGDAVVQQGRQLSLDRELVWVDAWAFERGVTTAHDRAAAEDGPTQALALYRGAFLAEDEGETWPVVMRERLRGKFIAAVSEHAARLEAEERHEEAIAWYQRGLDADNVVEPFYQGLMRCYHRLDRLPEAVGAYRRLKQMLSVALRLAPSESTEKLYRALRLE